MLSNAVPRSSFADLFYFFPVGEVTQNSKVANKSELKEARRKKRIDL